MKKDSYPFVQASRALSLPTSQETYAQLESIATSCRPREGGIHAWHHYHTTPVDPRLRGTTCIKRVGHGKSRSLLKNG